MEIMEYTLSEKAKDEINELLINHACYYPFEWIMGYNNLLSMQEQVPISNETRNEYYAIFSYAKKQCELLLSEFPNHNNSDDWKAGIEELNKTLQYGVIF